LSLLHRGLPSYLVSVGAVAAHVRRYLLQLSLAWRSDGIFHWIGAAYLHLLALHNVAFELLLATVSQNLNWTLGLYFPPVSTANVPPCLAG
jgi:hypothetical protein